MTRYIRPRDDFGRYQTHVYSDEDSVARAPSPGTSTGTHFAVTLGRTHYKRVGPHPRWSSRLALSACLFAAGLSYAAATETGMAWGEIVAPRTSQTFPDGIYAVVACDEEVMQGTVTIQAGQGETFDYTWCAVDMLAMTYAIRVYHGNVEFCRLTMETEDTEFGFDHVYVPDECVAVEMSET